VSKQWLTIIGGNQLKQSQFGPATNGFVRANGCVAIEAQDWIDGINHPEWGHNQIHGSIPLHFQAGSPIPSAQSDD
jgi:galactose mutarotase-like enzyme